MIDIDRISRHCASLLIENENLKIRIEKLEAALRDVLLWGNHCEACDYDDDWEKIELRSRKALEGKDD